MARGKNDSKNAVPVERYRKEIGKQDYKKSKVEIKEMKKKAQAKQSTNEVVKDIFILISFLVVVLGGIYLFLYAYLEKDMDTMIEMKEN